MRGRTSRCVAWLLPLALLAGVLGGAWIVLARPPGLFAPVLAVLVAAPILWVLVSALWPPRAERACPACGADALARMDPRTTHGLACRACGWSDESASGWLLAEEEGPLEEIVMAQRGRTRPPAVDSPRRSG